MFYINLYIYLYLYKQTSLVSHCFILECMVGYYGNICNRSCDGCVSDRCDSEHGICTDLSVCKPGWKPRQPKCDLGILIK